MTIAAATKLRGNIVFSVGATVFGGGGRDDGDGGGFGVGRVGFVLFQSNWGVCVSSEIGRLLICKHRTT